MEGNSACSLSISNVRCIKKSHTGPLGEGAGELFLLLVVSLPP